ncbi:MAG: hypothetical protein KME45_00255 [Stenomitos rutilans HA7619-LM2]|jgi:hypothetical protein|nr:hypothetical protein [Stenomitos rutilans HA7619-LM2]
MGDFLQALEASSNKYSQKLDALLEECKGLTCRGDYDEKQMALNASLALEFEAIIVDYETLISKYKELHQP